jgi:hypothetical protein
MPLITEQVHPLSLEFSNQRKVVIRRSHFKDYWSTIAGKVVNLAGDSPSPTLVARVLKTFSKKAGGRSSLMQPMSEACFSGVRPCPYFRLFAIIEHGRSHVGGN